MAIAAWSLLLPPTTTFSAAVPDQTLISTANTNAISCSAVDLRPAFEKAGIQRRQQGARPTCSVFTVVGALEFACSRLQPHQQLSVEFLNWAANQVDGSHHDGGFFSDLWAGFQTHGICTEKELPYSDQFNQALTPGTNLLSSAKTRLDLGLQLHWIKKWNVNTGLNDAEFVRIKETLRRGLPVCAGLRWPKSETWTQDVLGMCEPEAVRDGHSVLLVGYREDASQPGGGVLIFRNSNGRGRDGSMPYAYARAYMNDALWIADPGNSRAQLTPE